MRRILLASALLLSASLAHAACSGSATGCMSQGFSTGPGTAAASASATITDTAGDTAFSWVYMNCPSAVTVGTTPFTDTNSNSWEFIEITQYSSANSSLQVIFGWSLLVNGGVNTVNFAPGRSDCKLYQQASDYQPFIPVFGNSGSTTGNIIGCGHACVGGGSSQPLLGSQSSFPITPPDYSMPATPNNNVAYVLAISDGENTGTWGATSPYNSIGQSAFSGAAQMAAWDSLTGSAPSTLTVTNTASTTNAYVLTVLFNRQAAPPPTPGNPVNVCQTSIVGPSGSCSFSAPSGVPLMITVGVQGGGQVTLPTSTCGTPMLFTIGFYGGGNAGFAVIMNPTGGFCSIGETPTSGGSNTSLSFTVVAMTGMTATNSLVEVSYTNLASQGPAQTTIPLTAIDNAVAFYTVLIGTPNHSTNDWPDLGCTEGTVVANTAVSAGGDAGIGVCVAANQPAGTYSNTFSSSSDNIGGASYFTAILRSAPVTFGAVQQILCDTPVAGCSLPFPPTAGDQYDIVIPCPATPCLLDSNQSPTPVRQPAQGIYVDSWRVENISSAVTTFTVPSGAATNLAIIETRGLATSGSLYDAVGTMNIPCKFGDSVACSNIQNSSPIHLPRPGQYYLVSTLSSADGQSGTPSTGFVPRLLELQGDSQIEEVFDQILTTSSPAVLSNTITVANSHYLSAGLFAEGARTNTDPHVYQTIYSDAGGPQSFTNACTAGNTVLISAASSDGAGLPWTLSNTCGGTQSLLRGGTTADTFALWAINGVNAGTCTVSPSQTGAAAQPLLTGMELGPILSIQAANSVAQAAPPIATGNVTTVNSTSLVVSGLTAGNDRIESWCNPSDNSWGQVQSGYADFAGDCLFSKFVLTAGTWNNSGTTGADATFTAGWIAPLTLAPLTNPFSVYAGKAVHAGSTVLQ
jgi:hypothetical protein